MNQKNPAVKRIMADVRELERHPSSRYSAAPLEDNMFEWHFTIRGPAGSDFEGGMYHGRILLSAEYPFKPPNIVFLTRNGRFEVGTKICLSISAYHEESWQPAWGVRTMLEAIISFLPSEGAGAIGALDWSREERKKLATESRAYCCPICGPIASLLTEPADDSKAEAIDSDIAAQIAQMKMAVSASAANNSSSSATSSMTSENSKDNGQPTTTQSLADGSASQRGNIKDETKADAAAADLSQQKEHECNHSSTEDSHAHLEQEPLDAFGNRRTPSHLQHLDRGTPPSLKMVRRRILHSRHGHDYEQDDQMRSLDSDSRSATASPMLSPTYNPNQHETSRESTPRNTPNATVHAEDILEVERDRSPPFTLYDIFLLFAMVIVFLALAFLILRKVKRVLDDPSLAELNITTAKSDNLHENLDVQL